MYHLLCMGRVSEKKKKEKRRIGENQQRRKKYVISGNLLCQLSFIMEIRDKKTYENISLLEIDIKGSSKNI